MIFKIQRANQGNYFKHRESGEVKHLEEIPYRHERVEGNLFLGTLVNNYHLPDEWQALSGPMPIPNVDNNTIEIDTVDELCQLVKKVGYPFIITPSSGKYYDGNYSWILRICDGIK